MAMKTKRAQSIGEHLVAWLRLQPSPHVAVAYPINGGPYPTPDHCR